MTLRSIIESRLLERFEDGLYGTAVYNSEAIMKILDDAGLFDREGETKIELIVNPPSPGGDRIASKTIVITDNEGRSQNITIPDNRWIRGKPRPTELGVYQSQMRPSWIYTLYPGGMWRCNQVGQGNSNLSLADVPDNLIKIA